jgi:hypothetical protein
MTALDQIQAVLDDPGASVERLRWARGEASVIGAQPITLNHAYPGMADNRPAIRRANLLVDRIGARLESMGAV